MSDHVYKCIELVGSSETSVEDAVRNAIAKAAQTLRNLRWFEVIDTRGHIEGGQVALEESIALYARGAALRAHCEERLKAAEARVAEIAQGPDGSVRARPVEIP